MADYPLLIVQGETYRRSFRWLVDGVPQSLEGWSVRAQIRTDDRPRGRLILDLTPMFVMEPGGNVGTFVLTIGADITNDLSARDFRRNPRWDVFLVKTADPSIGRLFLEGPAQLNASATDVDGSDVA